MNRWLLVATKLYTYTAKEEDEQEEVEWQKRGKEKLCLYAEWNFH